MFYPDEEGRSARDVAEAFRAWLEDDARLYTTEELEDSLAIYLSSKEYPAEKEVDLLLRALGETDEERKARHLARG